MYKCCSKLLGLSWLVSELTCCKHGSACHMKGWRESALSHGGKMVMEEIVLHLCKIPMGFQLMWIQFDDLLPKYFVLH